MPEALRAVARSMGVRTASELAAAFRALSAASKRAAAAEKRLAAVEREDVLRENARKFSPALTAWARTQSVDALRAFVKFAPDLDSEHVRPAAPEESISDEEARLLRLTRARPETVKAIKSRKVGE